MSETETSSTKGSNISKEHSHIKTAFQIAYPPPTTSRKSFNRRPILLLQLQKIPITGRPIPVFDVQQSGTRLGERFLNKLRQCGSTLLNTISVTTSEEYSVEGETTLDLENTPKDCGNLGTIATFCQPRKEMINSSHKTKIHFNNGYLFEASYLSNGSYSFTRTEEGGQGQLTTVHWVLNDRGPGDDKKFVFKIIRFKTNAHQQSIRASMTSKRINIVERNLCEASTSGNLNSISKYDSDTLEKSNISLGNNTLCHLVLVTGLWVTLQEGFVKMGT